MSNLNENAEPFVMPAARTAIAVTSASTSELSRDAEPFTMGASHAGRRPNTNEGEERCLFMTFSTGTPLTKREIFQHFTREMGQCVEDVYVQEGGRGDPEFGMIKFTTSILPARIMMNRNVVKIWVNGKPIWLKKYVPRTQRILNPSN